ncbi:MAG TPA: molecular chaperone TorD family protein [Planctomycetota bacterium]|nr:molecular chaperone TorD family protein [Planctomycetota bacterium]
MEPALTTESQVDRALSRSFIYGVLASGFRPPSEGEILDGAGIVEPPVLDIEAGEPRGSMEDSVEDRETGIGELTASVLRAAAAADPVDLALDYEHLFGHTARGKVPPYETEYGSHDLFRQAQELADTAGFYRAFGLAIPESRRERSDHVSAECEFLSFLAFKEAYDLTRGESSSVDEVRRVERLFLKDHLGRFVRAFAKEVAREAGHPLYRALGELCFRFLTIECRAAGVAPGPQFLALRSDQEDDVPMACGSSCPLVPKGQETHEDS